MKTDPTKDIPLKNLQRSQIESVRRQAIRIGASSVRKWDAINQLIQDCMKLPSYDELQ